MVKHIFLAITFLFLTFNSISVLGQIPEIKRPQPNTLLPGVIIGSPHNHNSVTPRTPNIHYFNNTTQSFDTYERDRLEVQRRNIAMQQILNEVTTRFGNIQYELPSRAELQGTEYYYQAAKNLLSMLNSKKALSLKDAIFSVENAFFEKRLDYLQYEKAIKNLIVIAQMKSEQDGYDWNNPITKNIMLFRTLSDTLKIKLPLQESITISYPMQYDFDDFRGEKDYSKLFVTKLLSTHSGQCHSLPLLYLILCEAVGTEANLAFSPQHSYIKFKDQRNNWYNLELTQGRIVTDAFIVGSGFITAEAIKHKLYMEPQTKKQVIAHCLSDLAMGYIHKYGYDSFVIQCVDSALKYAPQNTSAF